MDNPPFSIQAEILDFYNSKGIDYFLFANGLTAFSVMKSRPRTNCILVGNSIIYENGAVVNTAFLTNLGEDRIRLAPDLSDAIKEANNDESEPQSSYEYPPNIKSPGLFHKDLTRGVAIGIKPEEVEFISRLEETPSGIFGGGAMIADTVVERLNEARLNAEALNTGRCSDAKVIHLSQSELAMLAELNRRARKAQDGGV